MAQAWRQGRGRLGPMTPILGRWRATAETQMGPVTCKRDYARFGDGWVKLEAEWTFKANKDKAPKIYRETAFFGPDADGVLAFWSFTNDGKNSQGRLADAPDAPHALCFEAQMDMGLARQLFWLDETDGFHWAVEAKRKSGWRRFTEHHYRPCP